MPHLVTISKKVFQHPKKHTDDIIQACQTSRVNCYSTACVAALARRGGREETHPLAHLHVRHVLERKLAARAAEAATVAPGRGCVRCEVQGETFGK